jgi:methyl-accepting chemotaxis protein
MSSTRKALTISTRIRSLATLGVLLAVSLGLLATLSLARSKRLAGEQLQHRLLQGERARLELATQAMADALGRTLGDLPDVAEQEAHLRRAVADYRFEADDSGYFFVYRDTTCVVLGPSPQPDSCSCNSVRVESRSNRLIQLHGSWLSEDSGAGLE